MIKIWHNSRCGKSRDSKNLLDERMCEYEIFEYLKQPITEEMIQDLVTKLGITDLREMMRPKEEEYKTLDLDNPNKTDAELIQAMIKFPKIIERPIVIKGDCAVIGRPIEKVIAFLAK